MASYQAPRAGRSYSMPVDILLREVARMQIPNGGLGYLSAQKVLGAPPGPSLRAGQNNRVIIYCGAFSPPHTGHIACIVDGLQHMGEDPDLGDFVACIVVPLDDEYLLQKVGMS